MYRAAHIGSDLGPSLHHPTDLLLLNILHIHRSRRFALTSEWCGSPPCPPFSIAGEGEGWLHPDSLPFLILLFLMAIHRPRIVYIEQVPELFTESCFYLVLKEMLSSFAYGCSYSVWDSREFVPQARKGAMAIFYDLNVPSAPDRLRNQPSGYEYYAVTPQRFHIPWKLSVEQYAPLHVPGDALAIYLHRDRTPEHYPRFVLRQHPIRTICRSYGTAHLRFHKVLGQLIEDPIHEQVRYFHPIELLACQGFSASTLNAWLHLYRSNTAHWLIPMFQAAGNTVPVPVIMAAFSSIDPSLLIGPSRLAAHLTELEAFLDSNFP
jgi:site-specific DNA-cytosine methylase